MQINKLKLAILIIVLLIIQGLTNALTIFYVDALTVCLVIIVLYGSYSFTSLIIISVIADWFSRWFLGTHLFGIIIITFFTPKLETFFNMSSFLSRLLLLEVFYSITLCLNLAIGYVFGNFEFQWINYIFDLVVVAPTMLGLFGLVIDRRFSDILI